MKARIARPALSLLVLALLALLAWLGLTGHLLLFAPKVELAEVSSGTEGSGTEYYTRGFDGGVRNAPASEAAMGTAQVTWAIDDSDGDGVYDLWLQLWHAEATRVKNLRAVIHASAGDRFVEIPQGDSWGEFKYGYGDRSLSVAFPNLGAHADGYRGTLFLRMRMSFVTSEPPMDAVMVEVSADLFRERFPLSGWRVHGTWELPLSTAADTR